MSDPGEDCGAVVLGEGEAYDRSCCWLISGVWEGLLLEGLLGLGSGNLSRARDTCKFEPRVLKS